ncbi:MAG TPA: GIY-YIG nuclease family protein [Caldisericia bacterium]|nr:GIY-YIG nuclease family protein [Caldisericia bacterium]HOL82655.1 GIY-YIG nuclease family protein [Caldisericia bacterium]HPP43978.1 GIY-YIG nuclease family protein [Caldisericia bacterium]HRT37604.1 GIY-YIG nuclease family protein [Caldisericia bacterium]HRU74248.1 GIY-YIG nuclease family protein [Caldisericia bacterium]
MRGIYILLIEIDKNIKIEIGSLGKINFDKRIYSYIGSVQNNLEKRAQRHKVKNKKLRWHIDYLLKNKSVKILKILYKNTGRKEECKIAKRLSKTEIPISKFGCSDCDCKSHLFKIKNLKNILNLAMEEL